VTRHFAVQIAKERGAYLIGSGANGNLTGEVIRDGSSAARAPHLGG
jgi:hypothetical protein